MAEQVQRIRRLLPRQDEVNRIHDQSGQQYALPQIAAPHAPPLAEFVAVRGLTGDGEPAKAETESEKTKQEQPGGKFREQRAAERQSESKEGVAVRRPPHFRESPNREQREKGYS